MSAPSNQKKKRTNKTTAAAAENLMKIIKNKIKLVRRKEREETVYGTHTLNVHRYKMKGTLRCKCAPLAYGNPLLRDAHSVREKNKRRTRRRRRTRSEGCEGSFLFYRLIRIWNSSSLLLLLLLLILPGRLLYTCVFECVSVCWKWFAATRAPLRAPMSTGRRGAVHVSFSTP